MIKIEIIGDRADDVQAKLLELASMVTSEPQARASLSDFPLQAVVEHIREQGYEVSISQVIADEIVERENKKTRRAKKEEPELVEAQEEVVWEDPAPEEIDAPISSVEASDKSDPEAFKDETIARLEALYFEDGGAQIVQGIRQKFKATRKKFRDLPADIFPQIAAELSAALESK